MSQVVTLGGVSSADACPKLLIRRVDRDILGEQRHELVAVSGRDGSWVFSDAPGNREFTIIGIIRADGIAAKRTAVHQLSAWLDTGGLTTLAVDDEPAWYWDVIVDKFPVDDALRYGEVEITFVASAYANATTISTESFTGTGTSTSGTFAVNDEVVAYPVIEITPTNGTLTSFAFGLNDDSLSWAGLLADDTTLTLSALSDTVTLGVNTDVNLTGAFNPGDVRMVDVSGTFFLIVAGLNTYSLSWTGTATSVDVSIQWRRRYR